MADPVEALLFDLVAWIAAESRPYDEVMEAWRTSCPRLPVWEEANDRGLITRGTDDSQRAIVSVTAAGRAFLASKESSK
jgi:hypothetical protein